MPPKKSKKKPLHRRGRVRRWARRLTALAALALLAAGALHVARLDAEIRTRFEGRRWQLPARVYGRPLELYAGLPLTASDVVSELQRLRYRPERGTPQPGTYDARGGEVRVRTRAFAFWDGKEPSRALRVVFDGGAVEEIADMDTGRRVDLARLDPPLVGSIYPTDGEDRVLVRLQDVPKLLVNALVAVEDRHFFEHWGVDVRAMARALWADIKAGAVVQGGSTLTQQLVKNFFLSSRRTLTRKLNEAAMAAILEYRYDKSEILQAYLNEVYLGQDGKRSIHGVGLASRFYFDRDVGELDLPQIALLVGMLRGPSAYDPRRNPVRARQRRNLVLSLLAERGVVSKKAARDAEAAPLEVTPSPSRDANPYPAFLDLVKRQLRSYYRDEDLRSEGLRIFTTLDTRFQEAAQKALTGELRRIERSRGMKAGTLEGAVAVVRPDSGEVLALVGGRDGGYAGFDRALDAARPIGSLAKPAVYLTALESGRYTLATPLDDSPVETQGPDGAVWAPTNYDHTSHGAVPLFAALAHSYNLATVRLGLDLGVPKVVETLRRLGVDHTVQPFPSVMLGAVDLSPLAVAQIYQTLASGGFRAPLRAIRDVTSADLQPVRRYPMSVEQAADPRAVYLLNAALQQVVREGTGRGLLEDGAGALGVAGKTGTTDDLRDSWFAGFTADWVGVVWVGRDDNGPTGLTGSTGALPVWGDLLRRVGGRQLAPKPPNGVEFAWVDPATGLRTGEDRSGSVELPFVQGTLPQFAPEEDLLGIRERLEKVKEWIRGLVE